MKKFDIFNLRDHIIESKSASDAVSKAAVRIINYVGDNDEELAKVFYGRPFRELSEVEIECMYHACVFVAADLIQAKAMYNLKKMVVNAFMPDTDEADEEEEKEKHKSGKNWRVNLDNLDSDADKVITSSFINSVFMALDKDESVKKELGIKNLSDLKKDDLEVLLKGAAYAYAMDIAKDSMKDLQKLGFDIDMLKV